MRYSLACIIALFLFALSGVLHAQVNVIAPNGGERWFIGETNTIRWSAVGPAYVRIEYSTDGGATWLNATPGGLTIPAALGSYAWTVPNTPSANALVRISDADNPAVTDRSDAQFSIVRAVLQVLAPNGGEKYDMAQPVTVTWASQNITTLRLEYSPDNGTTWSVAASGIPAAAGSYTFTPVALPTRLALVRLVDADRPNVRDQSDRTFEIMEAPIIIIYSPVTGDNLTQGQQTPITWDATRISAVDVLFSSDGGDTWTVIASNIPSPQWYYLWTVPNIKTQRGKIRVRQVGGPVIGETGLFTIGAEVQRFVRVVQPNGGEKYLEGDSVLIRWAFQGITNVTISFSSDGGATWNVIRANVSAGVLELPWKVTSPPGDRYLVKVDAGGGLSDTSDARFEVIRRTQPKITVIDPNGGEVFFVSSSDSIHWSASDVTGPMAVEYSADSGRTWKSIGTVAATGNGIYAINWPIPDDTTTTALVRVLNAAAADTSDAVFEITRQVFDPLKVVVPNGGEVWLMGQKRVITWSAPIAVTAVDIDFSTDGGANWQRIDSNVASAPGAMQYVWWIPTLGLETDAARIRVKNTALSAQRDISDRAFSIKRGPIADVPVAGERSVPHLIGSYPNPASGNVTIAWDQNVGGNVAITFYRSDGAQVASYTAGTRAAGTQHYEFDCSSLPSGVYLYEVRVGGGGALHGRMTVAR